MNWTQAQANAHEARIRAKDGSGEVGVVEVESELQEQIAADCRKRGWIAIRARMDMPTTFSGVSGIPDFIILADNGRAIFIEAKAAKGKLTREQLGFHHWAHKLGHYVHVVRSFEAFLEIVTKP